MFFALLLGGLLFWLLNQRGNRRQALLNEATAPQATNELPHNPDLTPSRPRTINEMADLVVARLKERTTP